MVIQVLAYCDGACINGRGGAGVVMKNHKDKVVKKSEPLGDCTNNEAEILALIVALEMVPRSRRKDCKVKLFTDSQVAISVCNGGGKASNLLQLGEQFDSLSSQFDSVELEWVKGHDKSARNRQADALATKAARSQVVTKEDAF